MRFLPPMPRAAATLAGVLAAVSTIPAQASLFSGETLDTVADWLAVIVLIIVPIIGIVVFWLVHVLPERFAEKRHHPQAQAIQVLCLLSLVFGGLLWPIAWLWAFTKPVAYKVAYGTDKHEDFFTEQLALAHQGKLSEHELDQLEAELDAMDKRAALAPDLRQLRDELAARRSTPALEGRSA